jgi:hypothetical protein
MSTGDPQSPAEHDKFKKRMELEQVRYSSMGGVEADA